MSLPSGLTRSIGTEVVIDAEFQSNIRRAQEEAIRRSVRSFPTQIRPLLETSPALREIVYGGAAVQRYIENGFEKTPEVATLLKQAGIENGDPLLKEAVRIYGLDPNDPIRDIALRLTPGALGIDLTPLSLTDLSVSRWNEPLPDLSDLQAFARETGIDKLLGWDTPSSPSPPAPPAPPTDPLQPSLLTFQPVFGNNATVPPITVPIPPILQPSTPSQPNAFIARSVEQSAIRYFLETNDYDRSFTVEVPLQAIQAIRRFGENPNAMPSINQSFFVLRKPNKKYIIRGYSEIDPTTIRTRIAPAVSNAYQINANHPNAHAFTRVRWIGFAFIRPQDQPQQRNTTPSGFEALERSIKGRIQSSVIAAAQAGRPPVRWELIERKQDGQTFYSLIPYFYTPSATGPSYRPIVIMGKTNDKVVPMPLEYVFLSVEEMRHWFNKFQFALEPQGGIYKMVWKQGQTYGITPAQIVNQLNRNQYVPLIITQVLSA